MKFILTKKFCVYVDFIENNNEFIAGYVGKGKQGRVNDFKKRSNHWKQIAKNHDWKRVVGFETDDENEAFEVEKVLIRELRTFIHNEERTRYACNHTLGGDGTSGWKPTKETCVKIGNGNRGKVHTKEHNILIGKNHGRNYKVKNKRKQSPETIEKRNVKLRGQKRTEEQRKRMKEIANSDQTKQKHSRSFKTVRALMRLAKRLGFTPGSKWHKGNVSCEIS